MNLSEEVKLVLTQALHLAAVHRHEYVTPETLLLCLMDVPFFREVYEECGGEAEGLKEKLLAYLDEYLHDGPDQEEGVEPDTAIKPQLSAGVGEILSMAGQSAYNSGNREIGIRHVLHALWNLEESYAVYYMEQQGVSETALLSALSEDLEERGNGLSGPDDDGYQDAGPGPQRGGDPRKESGSDTESRWKLYAPCLNDTLQDENPLIGREAELARTIQILCRKEKNNPLHIGETGVGKTAITYGLVRLLNAGKVPDAIKGARIYALDLGGMLAGTQYRGDFEKRFKRVLAGIAKEEKPIIYIDEIHNLSGAGAVGEGSFDASNLLKPWLSGGRIRFIGATTYTEYKKYFEKNKSLARRFQNVEVKEPSEEETVAILNGLKGTYENYHGVKYARDVMEYAVRMSASYIHERFLPDKAIDLIDEAGAYRKLHPLKQKTQTVTKDVINEILTDICRVPIETVRTDADKGLATLEKRLKSKVFGQDEAVSQVTNAVKFAKAGLKEDLKPLGSLLFVGPTGVGKTEVAKCLAEELGIPLLRFDMSEYAEKHTVAKLIGSPAGYVGYEEGGLLTEAVRKSPNAVLLLDEIEKAHADIYNVLLQVLDYATLTDNQGRKADFRNVIIIMTSNAGASRIGKSSIGFNSGRQNYGALMEEVKRTFMPEFRNRLDRIVLFRAMDDSMALRIVEKKLGLLKAQLAERKIAFSADQKASALLRKKGISPEFGAREIDRVIRNEVKPLFVDEILFGKLKKGGVVKLSAEEDAFVVRTGKG